MPDVLIVGNSGSADIDEATVEAWVKGGETWVATEQAASTVPANIGDYDMAIINESVINNHADWADEAIPQLWLRAIGIVSSGTDPVWDASVSMSGARSAMLVKDGSHAIVTDAGFADETTYNVLDSSTDNAISNRTYGADVALLAEPDASFQSTDRVVWWACDAGGTDPSVPARRAGYVFNKAGNWNTNGLAALESSSRWLVGIVDPPTGNQNINPTAIASGSTVGGPTLTVGSVDINAGAIGSGATLGTPTSDAQTDLIISAIASVATIGASTIEAGSVDINPTGYGNPNNLGVPDLQPGAVSINPTAISSSVTFGVPFLESSDDISPVSVSSTVTIGVPTVELLLQEIQPTSHVNSPTLGTPTVTTGGADIEPTAIASTANYGIPTVSVGAVDIDAVAIASVAAVGTPTLNAAVDITLTSIPSGNTFGIPVVDVPEIQSLNPSGVMSTITFGIPAVTILQPENIAATSIPSGESLGTPELTESFGMHGLNQVVRIPATSNDIEQVTGDQKELKYDSPQTHQGVVYKHPGKLRRRKVPLKWDTDR